jgi:hypothetical protein
MPNLYTGLLTKCGCSTSSRPNAPVTAAVGQLLAACEAAGVIRRRLDPADVLLLMGFLWRTGPGEDGKAQAARLLDLVIDGFRPAEALGPAG